MENKIKINTIFLVIIIILLSIGLIYIFLNNNSKPKEENNQNPTTQTTTTTTINSTPTEETDTWTIYHNDKYNFEFKYPPMWQFRDGYKDYKITGLNDFYQFCESVTPPNPSDPHFVGTCNNMFFKIAIWKPTTVIETIMLDFSNLKLVKTEDIIIDGKVAQKYSYSGASQIDGLNHIWRIITLKTKDFIYVFTGDSCDDKNTECDKILSTFNLL